MRLGISIRFAWLVLAVSVTLISLGCDVAVGVGVSYGYPGAWGPYHGAPVGGWHGGPVWP